jgi:hypothetical protein
VAASLAYAGETREPACAPDPADGEPAPAPDPAPDPGPVPAPEPVTVPAVPPASPLTPTVTRPQVMVPLGAVDRRGRLSVRVRCPVGARLCVGVVIVRARLAGPRGPWVAVARRSVRVGAGRIAVVSLRVSPPARRALARRPVLRAQVRVVPARGVASTRSALLRARR